MAADRKNAQSGTYEYFDHAADVGIRVQALSLPLLFETSAHALLAWIGPKPRSENPVPLDLAIEGEGLEELMVRWLQEVLYLFYQRRAYFVGIESFHLAEASLKATVLCKTWEASRYQDYQEVKAVTYHQLRVFQEESVWTANVILDI